jgi:hypothetical protein
MVYASLPASLFAGDLDKLKMEAITTKVLDIFKAQSSDKSEQMKKYISRTWISENEINLKKYKINTYAPTYYTIYGCGSDFCIAEIGGEKWAHILVFQFTEENGSYRLVPMGISTVSNDYIEPWMFVKNNFYDKQK